MDYSKNKFAKWVASRHNSKAEQLVFSDELDDYIQDSTSVEGNIVLSEDLQSLRRELALIRSDYRRILVAHYIEDKSVSMIAREENLPIGTVKTKLQNSRKQLKEGMNMAREFGKRSYNPEEITFVNNGSHGSKGQPWTILSHKLYKNIFLEAYGNPLTAEQLALELGVAMPYMEDELEYLTEQTFLKKEGKKYETNFPIISREAQIKIYDYNVERTPECTKLLEAIIDLYNKACVESDISYYGNFQDYESAKWTLLMRAFDWLFYSDSQEAADVTRTKRPDNGAWDIVGYQDVKLNHPAFVGLHGYNYERAQKSLVRFNQYRYYYQNIYNKTPEYLTHDEVLTLQSVYEGKWEQCEKKYIEKLLTYGFIKKDGTEYKPAILVFDGNNTDKYYMKFSKDTKEELTKLSNLVKQLFSDIWVYATEVIKVDLPSSFRNDERLFRTAIGCSAYDRGYVLEQANKDNWLKYDETTSPVIGAYLVV